MKASKPRRTLDAVQAFAFEAHENLGVALLAVLVLHWLLFFAGHAHLAIGHFFPWFAQTRLAALIQELKGIGRLGLADPEAQNAFASAVQRLGLVIASLLASSGMVLYLGIAANGSCPRRRTQ